MSAINGAADQSAASFGYQELTDDRSDFSAPKRTPFERLERIVRTACRPVVRRLPGRIQRSLKRLSDIRRNRVLLERLPFDEETYLRLNPDVAETVRQERFASGLEHFVTFGIDELETSPNRVLRIPLHGLQFDFDPPAYCIDNPDAAMLIAQGRYRSAIDHFLRAGYDQCREGIRSLYAPDRLVRCLAVEDGDLTLARNRRYLALFAHYDQAGVVDDYVVHYLKALRDAGADICFITSSAAPNELNKIRQYAFRIIIKNDAGRDFGSWYLTLKNIQAELRAQYDYVLLVNDSVYFPVVDCGRMFDGMATLKFDLWGITDSRQSARYHLQSYFLGLNRTAQGVLIPWLMETISSNSVHDKIRPDLQLRVRPY